MLTFSKKAKKTLDKLQKKDRSRVEKALAELEDKGQSDRFRIDKRNLKGEETFLLWVSASLRVLYRRYPNDKGVEIYVISLGQRENIYNDMQGYH